MTRNIDVFSLYMITLLIMHTSNLHNLLRFLSFYNVLRAVCLVNNRLDIYIYIKCI